MSADDGIDRAGTTTMRAANAQALINDGNGRGDKFGQRHNFPSQQVGQPPYSFFTTRRAEINRHLTFNHGGGKWPTAGITTLSTLCLREQVIDLLDEVA